MDNYETPTRLLNDVNIDTKSFILYQILIII